MGFVVGRRFLAFGDFFVCGDRIMEIGLRTGCRFLVVGGRLVRIGLPADAVVARPGGRFVEFADRRIGGCLRFARIPVCMRRPVGIGLWRAREVPEFVRRPLTRRRRLEDRECFGYRTETGLDGCLTCLIGRRAAWLGRRGLCERLVADSLDDGNTRRHRSGRRLGTVADVGRGVRSIGSGRRLRRRPVGERGVEDRSRAAIPRLVVIRGNGWVRAGVGAAGEQCGRRIIASRAVCLDIGQCLDIGHRHGSSATPPPPLRRGGRVRRGLAAEEPREETAFAHSTVQRNSCCGAEQSPMSAGRPEIIASPRAPTGGCSRGFVGATRRTIGRRGHDERIGRVSGHSGRCASGSGCPLGPTSTASAPPVSRMSISWRNTASAERFRYDV